MRMPGEARQIVVGVVVAKIVEQEKWIKFVGLAEAKRPAQMHARAFDRRLRLDDSFNGSYRHNVSSA